MGNINSIQTKNYIKFEKYYYAGDLNVDNLPHGRGLMLYENGNSFFGHFINGKKHGVIRARQKANRRLLRL